MKEAFDFLRSCGTFYLATEEDGQPRVRPFGAISDFEGKWIRIEGTVKEDLRREASVAMLEANPSLKGLASPDNGTMTVFYFESGTATICSFTEAPKVITL